MATAMATKRDTAPSERILAGLQAKASDLRAQLAAGEREREDLLREQARARDDAHRQAVASLVDGAEPVGDDNRLPEIASSLARLDARLAALGDAIAEVDRRAEGIRDEERQRARQLAAGAALKVGAEMIETIDKLIATNLEFAKLKAAALGCPQVAAPLDQSAIVALTIAKAHAASV